MSNCDWQHGGWIYKQGSLVRNWKRRFMVLRGKRLTYYDTASINSATKEKGSFQVITAELSSDIQNGLLVHGVGGRVLKLYTDSAQSTSDWYNAILNATTPNATTQPLGAQVVNKIEEDTLTSPENGSFVLENGTPSSQTVNVLNTSCNGTRLDMNRLSTLSNPSNNTSAMRYSYMSNQDGNTSVDVDSEIELMDQLDLNKDIQESQLLHSGWLLKQGSRVKSWKRRYFTLRGRILSYFDSQDVGSACKGHGKVMGAEVNPLRINSLNIKFESGRVLCVAAESQRDMDMWFDRLNAVVNATIGRATELKTAQYRATMPSLMESAPTTRSSMMSMHQRASTLEPPVFTAPPQSQKVQMQSTQSKQQMAMRHSMASMPSTSSSEFEVDNRLSRIPSSNNYSTDDLVDSEYGSDDSEGDWL